MFGKYVGRGTGNILGEGEKTLTDVVHIVYFGRHPGDQERISVDHYAFARVHDE